MCDSDSAFNVNTVYNWHDTSSPLLHTALHTTAAFYCYQFRSLNSDSHLTRTKMDQVGLHPYECFAHRQFSYCTKRWTFHLVLSSFRRYFCTRFLLCYGSCSFYSSLQSPSTSLLFNLFCWSEFQSELSDLIFVNDNGMLTEIHLQSNKNVSLEGKIVFILAVTGDASR